MYTTSARGANGKAGVTVLFGSVFGLSSSQTTLASIMAIGLIVVMLAIVRPLLFASIDADVAAAQGVPVRLLGMGFLALVGITAGEATQAVGAMLLLGLLSAPAAAAQRLTIRPYIAMALSSALALIAMWAGLSLSYAVPRLPPSFAIMAVATGLYVIALAWSWLHRPQRRGPSVSTLEPAASA
jgi:zinc/manganese transport system permease protein